MPTTDPRVDAYIEKAKPFAQPVLEKIRLAFHKAGPEVTETIKWGNPAFETEHGILGGMAAFKAHVAFSLWRGMEIEDPEGLFTQVGNTAMAWIQVPDVKALPTQKVMRAYIKRAARHTASVKAAPKKKTAKKKAAAKKKRAAPKTPPELTAAFKLKKHAKAKATFDSFPPSAKRDYVEWITGAKRDATRAKRLETTLAWLAEGKRRNWKYESS